MAVKTSKLPCGFKNRIKQNWGHSQAKFFHSISDYLYNILLAGCTSNTECEQQVDSFLNSYCTSALPSTVTQPGPTTTVTRTETQPAVTVTRVQTTTSISTVTVTPAASGSPPSTSSSSNTQSGQTTVNVASMGEGSPQASSSSVPRAEFALAALFGLAIIVLMAVIAGWALTYLIMRKRAKENNGIARTG